MKVIVGHETGVLRVIQLPLKGENKSLVKRQVYQHEKREIVMEVKGKVEKDKAIVKLINNKINQIDENWFWLARQDLTLELMNEEYEMKCQIDIKAYDKQNDISTSGVKWITLHCYENYLLACKTDGTIYHIKIDKDLKPTIQHYKLYTKEIQNRLAVVKPHPTQKDIIASGGNELELAVWKFEEDKYNLLFQSKNVPHDKLDLRVKVWVTDLAFLDDMEKGFKVAIVTHYGQLRTYETQTKKRPVLNYQLYEKPCLRIQMTNNNEDAIISNNEGDIFHYKLNSGKLLGKFKGSTGSLRHLKVTQDRVFSLSLDRFLRVHHLNERSLEQRVYLKQVANCFLIQQEEFEIKEEDETDLLWKELETSSKKKIKLTNQSAASPTST